MIVPSHNANHRRGILTRFVASSEHPAGFNVVGHVSGNFGLAVAARNTLHALVEGGHSFVALDVEAGGGRTGHDSTYSAFMRTPAEAPFSVNLFHLNPPDALALIASPPAWLDTDTRFNACVPFWELPRLPTRSGWVPLLEAMDVVLAPSRFVFEAVQASAPRAEVWHYPQAVYMPEGITPDRAAFDLPAGGTLFFMNLDITSDTSRKNPAAALEAFSLAFGGGADAHLIVRLNNSTAFSWATSAAQGLLRLIEGHPNIHVIDGPLTYREVLSLSASCDVYVSLHRSEGLGLNLLEAMSLGKPVIATSWSGNMDFMTPGNSCLVGYRLVPVVADHAAYQPSVTGPGQVWADPDIAEAAEWMRVLAADPDLRRSIGARAQTDMESRREAFARGDIYEALLTAAAHPSTAGAVRERRSRWARLRLSSLPAGARRAAGRCLRALGLRR